MVLDDILKRWERDACELATYAWRADVHGDGKRQGDGWKVKGRGALRRTALRIAVDDVDNKKGLCSDTRGMLWRKPRLPSMVRWPVREIREP